MTLERKEKTLIKAKSDLNVFIERELEKKDALIAKLEKELIADRGMIAIKREKIAELKKEKADLERRKFNQK